jgi:2'-hydroxyisoflavone reductase
MRLLVLGGTLFLGRHIVDAAQERGHDLTLFNRGRSGPEAFADIEQIHGDRGHDLPLLARRSWDAVIDTSGYVPRNVRASTEALADSVEHYTFVSSISAYATFARAGLDEDAPVASLSEADSDSQDVEQHYGALKAACEREVQAALPGRALVVRPGLIVGPHDPTERFTYWVARLAEGGRVLVPDAPEQPMQLIDARDLADWTVRMAERRATGTFNATGPSEPLTFGSMLKRTAMATEGGSEIVWVDEQRLVEAGVEPFSDLPLWLGPERESEYRGFLDVDIRRALAAGLALRPLEQTIADTLAWVRDRTGSAPPTSGFELPPAGISREREAELLSLLAP